MLNDLAQTLFRDLKKTADALQPQAALAGAPSLQAFSPAATQVEATENEDAHQGDFSLDEILELADELKQRRPVRGACARGPYRSGLSGIFS